jgi:riboflavin kinase/FMN adenylyltransferase
MEQGEAVSATRIRRALGAGDVEAAGALLGWHFAVTGTITHGDKRGRTLGYPTANMVLDPACGLLHGIYAVRLLRRDGSLHDGVASYGRRPTFGGGDPVLETFVFDFTDDLYDEEVLVALYGFIRTEQKFDDVEALVARMDQDSLEARAHLERTAPGELDAQLYLAWARAPG